MERLTFKRHQELLFEARAERDEAERRIAELETQHVTVVPAVNTDPIPKPVNVKSFPIHQLREMMDLASDEHKEEWNNIRVFALMNDL